MSEHIWQQQPGESDKAHAAFVIYMGLPAHDRSIDKAYAKYCKDNAKKVQKRASSHWHGWSRTYSWPKRVTAHDKHLRRIEELAFEAKRKKHGEYRRQIFEGFLSKLINKMTSLTNDDIDTKDLIAGLRIANEVLRKEYGEVDNKQEVHIKNELSKVLEALKEELPPELYRNVLIRIDQA